MDSSITPKVEPLFTRAVPPSVSFSDDDIPSVMIECDDSTLSIDEIALIGVTLALTTSDSLDESKRDNRSGWANASTIAALRGRF